MDDVNNVRKFLAKMNAGKMCAGAVVTMSDPAVSELAGDSGLDFIWIDAEHAPHTIQDVMKHIMAVRGTDCAPLVRVAWNDMALIKPVLDLAPAGIIIPMVCNAEEAARAVALCKYPPRGMRGVGVRRAARYGAVPFNDYLKTPESEPLVIIQIEHVDAVKNLDEILKVPGIDSICVGPCDLGASMGLIEHFGCEEINSVIDGICEKARAAGVRIGTADAYDERWRKRGASWVACASDSGAMAAAFRGIAAQSR